MFIIDRIISFNAWLARFTIPGILLKGLLGYALGGVVLALMVPPLHARGIVLRGWMVWSTILGMIAICVAPDLYRRYRRRGGKAVA
jgi:hypothetical protein